VLIGEPSGEGRGGNYMVITTLSRTISGLNYDNLSVTANLEDGDNPIEKAKELDAMARKMMDEISAQRETQRKQEQERSRTIDEIPF